MELLSTASDSFYITFFAWEDGWNRRIPYFSCSFDIGYLCDVRQVHVLSAMLYLQWDNRVQSFNSWSRQRLICENCIYMQSTPKNTVSLGQWLAEDHWSRSWQNFCNMDYEVSGLDWIIAIVRANSYDPQKNNVEGTIQYKVWCVSIPLIPWACMHTCVCVHVWACTFGYVSCRILKDNPGNRHEVKRCGQMIASQITVTVNYCYIFLWHSIA